MKKRMFVLMLVLALLVTPLAACRSTPVVEPTRGAWEDHVFTSEYLGLRFIRPNTWDASTDAEIAALAGLTAEFLAEAGTEIPDDVEELVDMMSSSSVTGASVQIRYQRVGGAQRLLEDMRDQFLEAVVEEFESLGGRVHLDATDVTRIGAYEWDSFGTEMDMHGMTIYGRQFFTFQYGFLRTIVITTTPISESVDDILTMFIGLDAPIPEPPAIEHAAELVGTWAWDESDEYILVFYADGQGSRGFPGQTQSFEWQTEGDDHLLRTTAAFTESWTFTVRDGVLTIDSRQQPGLTWSYILQPIE